MANSYHNTKAYKIQRYPNSRNSAFYLVSLFLFFLLPVVYAEERTAVVLSDNWLIRQLDSPVWDINSLKEQLTRPDEKWMAALMPAQVHDVLLQYKKITDPHIGTNSQQASWVAEKDWIYACKFKSPPTKAKRIFLRFDGLDTLAEIYLNGSHIASCSNMHKEYAVEVQDKLKPTGQENTLFIIFASPLRFMREVKPTEQNKMLDRSKFLRKSYGDFSSYLGARPHFVKVGIFRDVWLDITSTSWIEDICVRTKLSSDFSTAKIFVSAEMGGSDCGIEWTFKNPEGKQISYGQDKVKDNKISFTIDVNNPKLWWPRTHGRPDLYELSVVLTEGGKKLDEKKISVGIRDIKPVLSDPKTGENRFRFDINGKQIFLMGANWVPVEGATHCWQPQRTKQLLNMLEHGQMNIMRVWGEGHIPPKEFYDECDKRGILIWQDFMFGYNMHPSDIPEFAENCREELEQVIRRLRNHPCILLWCGGNENYMGWDFQFGTKPTVGLDLFEKIMPQACEKLDPTRLFHPSSPFGGSVPNWPSEGDWHDYSTLTFSPMSSVPLFGSEVGRASTPSLSSMKLFLSDEELWPKGFDPSARKPGQAAWPPMWQYRSVNGSWEKVGAMERYCDPCSAEDLIRILGTAHGQYLRERIERERRGIPDGQPDGNRRCWGNIIWRLNDSWPIIYWSVIDYYLEPKMAYYYLRRAYNPVLISFEQTADEIFVWLINDSPNKISGTLSVQRRRFDGKTIDIIEKKVELGPAESKRLINATKFGPVSLREEFLQANLNGQTAVYLLTSERYLHLPTAKLSAAISKDQIEIETDVFSYQVSIQMENAVGAVFEDNYFDMPPKQKRTIKIINPAGGNKLTICSLNSQAVSLQLNKIDSLPAPEAKQ